MEPPEEDGLAQMNSGLVKEPLNRCRIVTLWILCLFLGLVIGMAIGIRGPVLDYLWPTQHDSTNMTFRELQSVSQSVAMMDIAEDPCTNWYGYVCGTYATNTYKDSVMRDGMLRGYAHIDSILETVPSAKKFYEYCLDANSTEVVLHSLADCWTAGQAVDGWRVQYARNEYTGAPCIVAYQVGEENNNMQPVSCMQVQKVHQALRELPVLAADPDALCRFLSHSTHECSVGFPQGSVPCLLETVMSMPVTFGTRYPIPTGNLTGRLFEMAISATVELLDKHQLAPPAVKQKIRGIKLHSTWSPEGYTDYQFRQSDMKRLAFSDYMLQLYRWQVLVSYNMLTGSGWKMYPWDMNAYYSVLDNAMFVPANMQDEETIVSNNMLAYVMLHEIGHSVDPDGRYYVDGRKKTTPIVDYTQFTNCLTNVYDNGKQTLNENVADYIALEALAIMNKNPEYPKNNGLGLLSVAELKAGFFNSTKYMYVVASQMWCTSNDVVHVTTDVHSGPHQRTELLMSLSPEWETLFDCRRKTPCSL